MPSAAASFGPWMCDGLALEEDLARVDGVDAGDALDERRLAGAVVADERHDLARGRRGSRPRRAPARRRSASRPRAAPAAVCRSRHSSSSVDGARRWAARRCAPPIHGHGCARCPRCVAASRRTCRRRCPRVFRKPSSMTVSLMLSFVTATGVSSTRRDVWRAVVVGLAVDRRRRLLALGQRDRQLRRPRRPPS